MDEAAGSGYLHCMRALTGASLSCNASSSPQAAGRMHELLLASSSRAASPARRARYGHSLFFVFFCYYVFAFDLGAVITEEPIVFISFPHHLVQKTLLHCKFTTKLKPWICRLMSINTHLLAV